MRPPSVFVRSLAPVEGQRLKRLSKRAKHSSTRQRAMILLASATLMSPAEIARAFQTDESHVRKLIHEFNERGFDSLRPRFGGGRPRRITDEQRARIVSVAGARPDSLGVPLTRWSLSALSRYLRGQGIAVSPAHLGRILAESGLSFLRTRSWLASPDPDYEAKAARLLSLYAKRPKDGIVISFDEAGPLQPLPEAGEGLGRAGPPRTPAGQLHATGGRPPPLRCLRGPRRLPPRPPQTAQERPRGLGLHENDSPGLPEAAAALLDPGQPLLSLDEGDPRLRRRQTTSNSSLRPPTPAT